MTKLMAILLLAFSWIAAADTTVQISANQAQLSSSFKGPTRFDDKKVKEVVFKSIENLFFVSKLEKIKQVELSTTTNNKGTKTIKERAHFFIRGFNPKIPEALISVDMETKDCSHTQEDPCNPSVKFTLGDKLKLYTTYTNYAFKTLSTPHFNWELEVKKEKLEWKNSFNATLNNLLLFDWLKHTHKIFGMESVPTVHQSLLFLNQNSIFLNEQISKSL